MAVSAAIDRLVALSATSGVAPAASSDGSEFRAPGTMPDAVREAGFADPALAYLRSADNDSPDEGFVDEAAQAYLFFPLDPAHDLLGDVVAARLAAPPPRRHPLLGGIVGLVGIGMVVRSFLHPDAYSYLRIGTGILLVIGATLLLRRHRRSA